jgi:hypothetical protein
MLHLPQYLGLDEDYSGAARLLEAVGVLYGLPLNFPEAARGRRQYRRITEELRQSENAETQELVSYLEDEYDGRSDGLVTDDEGMSGEGPSPLAPDVQRFLQDLDALPDD